MITCKYKSGWLVFDDKQGVLYSLNDGRREYKRCYLCTGSDR